MKPQQHSALSSDELRQLVFRAGHGDVDAFGEIYDNLYDRVYVYAYRRSYDQSAAQDITANTFYKMMTHLSDFMWRDDARFYAWVFRITMNELARYFRDEKRYQTYEDWLSIVDTIPDEQPTPHEQAAKSEQNAALRRSIEALPAKQREVVELYYFGGIPHQAIADTLKIRPGTARVRLHRALETLEQGLKGEGYVN